MIPNSYLSQHGPISNLEHSIWRNSNEQIGSASIWFLFGLVKLVNCKITIRFADQLVTTLSGRVNLGARRVWGKLGNLLGLLSPAPSDVSEFVRVVSRRLHGACSLVATGRERRV